MFLRLIFAAIGAMLLLTYIIEVCLAPMQLRRAQYDHANWISKCLEWSRLGCNDEAKFAALQVEQLRKDIDFLRSLLRPWARLRRRIAPLLTFFLVGCSGAPFEAGDLAEEPDSGSAPVVRSRLPQDALAPVPDADAGPPIIEGTGGRPGAGGTPSTGGAAVQVGTGGQGTGGVTVLGSGGAVSTGGQVAAGTGGAPPVRTPAQVLQSLNRPDCIVDMSTVNCDEWRPTVDVHPVGIRCAASPPLAITAPGCHQSGPIGSLWCCLP